MSYHVQAKKQQESKSKTQGMSMVDKVEYYEKKEKELKEQKQFRKSKYQEIRTIKISSQNVLQFKLDENTKKMKNEIYRLQEESRRHEESQKNENQKIGNHINYLRENCDGLDKAFKDILDRVIFLEKTLGPA